MTKNEYLWHMLMLLIATSFLISGCSTTGKKPKVVQSSVSQQRRERNTEVVEDFEKRRGAAEVETALAHFQRGDNKSCETMLKRLLERKPDHEQANLALADLYVAMGQEDDAKKQLESLLEQRTNCAQAHHSLAMLLDTQGQTDKAQTHFSKAIALDPDNETYKRCQKISEGASDATTAALVKGGAESSKAVSMHLSD